jgi:hypothetical protein
VIVMKLQPATAPEHLSEYPPVGTFIASTSKRCSGAPLAPELSGKWTRVVRVNTGPDFIGRRAVAASYAVGVVRKQRLSCEWWSWFHSSNSLTMSAG